MGESGSTFKMLIDTSRRADGISVGGRTTLLQPHVGQRHEDVEKEREYYHIIFFSWKDLKFYFKKEEDMWKS